MCMTLKEGEYYMGGGNDLEGGKEEKRAMKSLCYESIYGDWEAKAFLRDREE